MSENLTNGDVNSIQLDRDPAHEMMSGEIASINNNERNKDGAPMGVDHKIAESNEAVKRFNTLESGLITTEQVSPMFSIRKAFIDDFVNGPMTTFHKRLSKDWIEIEIFIVNLADTKYVSANGVEQYDRYVFPIGKVMKTGPESQYLEGDLVRLPSSLKVYGPNPDWIAWNKERKSSDVAAAMEDGQTDVAVGFEPPKYWGDTLNAWIEDYGSPVSPFTLHNSFTTRFVIPEAQIHSAFDTDSLIKHFNTILDEINQG